MLHFTTLFIMCVKGCKNHAEFIFAFHDSWEICSLPSAFLSSEERPNLFSASKRSVTQYVYNTLLYNTS